MAIIDTAPSAAPNPNTQRSVIGILDGSPEDAIEDVRMVYFVAEGGQKYILFVDEDTVIPKDRQIRISGSYHSTKIVLTNVEVINED